VSPPVVATVGKPIVIGYNRDAYRTRTLGVIAMSMPGIGIVWSRRSSQ